MGVRASIIRIGNSRGIRIPRALIDECRLGETVELSVVDGALVVRSATRPRQSWDEAFARMAEAGEDGRTETGEDALANPETTTDSETAEWEWPEF